MNKMFTLLCAGVQVVAFAATSYAVTLTVASSNPTSGVAVTMSPNDTTGQNNGTTQFTRNYNTNTVVSLTAPAGMTGKKFQKWRKGNKDYSTNRAITLTMPSSSTTMTAYFLNDTTAPVTTASPAAGSYSGSVTVTLTANETATTYYCTGSTSCTPTTVYTAPLAFTSTTILRYYSKDVANNSESTKTGTYTITGPVNPHSGITGTFNTPKDITAKCLTCHNTEGSEAVSSLHGMMPTPSPNVTNATGLSQKLNEINTFCSYPNPDMAGAACLTCHPTLGKFENLVAADIDCLMCHNDAYKRMFAAETNPADYINVVDWQGTPKTYIPADKDASGNYYVAFDWANMAGQTATSLIAGVHRPTTTTCLRCHAKAGGGDWVKRGDIGLNSSNPTAAQDIHLASVANGGKGLTCSSCHVPAAHKIPGRGIDLRPTETGVTMKTCVTCHPTKATSTGHATADVNRHVARVSCQACHIPTFGKGGATEMSRNWTQPHWIATLCNGQGAWAGLEVKTSNVPSDFAFFNGTSYVYKLGQLVDRVDPVSGYKTLADANGGINDTAGATKLVPIKRHLSNMAIMSSGTNINKLIPYDVTWQFMTGLSDEAAERGKAYAGYTGTHTWQWVEAEMAINHGVAPKSAVLCANCHDGVINTSADSKLDKLGYKAKKPTSDLCNDCHSSETDSSHTSLHSRHRGKAACSSCHNFSRP